ncbi:MAG TPA: type IV pilus twitching motility protein PilT [Myxococcus sp.]|nr:type IV pilus twitching motility protein PilT [Myxococcus sp.]
MARLDIVIEKLYREAGQELVFASGSGVSMRTSAGLVPVLKQNLTAQQLIGALSELVPADLRAGFPEDGVTQFPYLSPAGAVKVWLENSGGQLKATMTPFGAPPSKAPAPRAAPEPAPEPAEEKLELASPADMMEMASAQATGAAPRAAPARPAAAPARTPTATRAPAAAPPAPAAAPPAPAPRVEVSGDAARAMAMLLEHMLDQRASDLHLTSETVPNLRIDGDMVPQEAYGAISSARLKAMLWSIAPEKNKEQWEQLKDTDFAHETERARFRVNVFADRKGIGAVLRQIPNTILSAEQMGLSKHILDLCFLSKGLVLVTGPTGSGKSTTLAAMIDYINRHREDHIITIEDPIEFVHPNKKCLVNQREVGVHTSSFKHALRAALREDPDIVLVGELRDLETIAIAIETAETGHLVFGTLHTNTAPSTVDRIIDQFPPDRQSQIRMMLSESLKGVISQTLCKKIGGGRAAAQEVLLCTGSVANLIREGKTFQIPSVMQTGRGAGMVTMNDALFDLVKRKVVDPTDAYTKAIAKSEFKTMLERGGFKLDLPNG